MRKAELERALEAVPRHPAPSPELEQYRTPPGVAAQFLLLAHADGAIAGKRVLDLGCGTGILAVGAALLGARLATVVDIDAPSIALAQDAASRLGVADRAWFVAGDVAAWAPDAGAFDTVVMNPPFGAQKANRHADRAFVAKAAEAVSPAGTVWFLALARTEGFLAQQANGLGARIERVAQWEYPLEATMAHHREAARTVEVGGYRLSWPM